MAVARAAVECAYEEVMRWFEDLMGASFEWKERIFLKELELW